MKLLSSNTLGIATGESFHSAAPDHGLLVGMRFLLGKSNASIVAMQPVYQAGESYYMTDLVANSSARTTGQTYEAIALPGYAIGAASIAYSDSAISGMKLTFMRVDDKHLDTVDTYESSWYGRTQKNLDHINLGGRIVTGCFGSYAQAINSFGLSYLDHLNFYDVDRGSFEGGTLSSDARQLKSQVNAGHIWEHLSPAEKNPANFALFLTSPDEGAQLYASQALLAVPYQEVTDASLRKKIACAYKELAMTGKGALKINGIRGIVHWGKKYSLPLLIPLLDAKESEVRHEVMVALGSMPDVEAAKKVVRFLGTDKDHQAAFECLKSMGTLVEPVLIAAAPSNNEAVSLACVELLADVGTKKSYSILRLASRSQNPKVAEAAWAALRKISERS